MNRNSLIFILMGIISFAANAGSVFKCKQADGSVTFSDTACPSNTVSRHYKPEYENSRSSQGEISNPYSVVNQANRVDRKIKNNQNQSAVSSIDAKRQSSVPLLSYEEARRRALKETGYRDYSRLTKSQRQRVNSRMATFNHLPPEIEGNSPTSSQSQFLHNPFTGQTMPRTGGGFTDPRSGTFYQEVAGGVVNTRTGQFIPTN